jgi:hypothetical protein
MDATKHLRILARIYLIISAPIFVLSCLVFWWATAYGGEAGLIALPAGVGVMISAPMVAAAFGLRRGHNWGMVVAVICALLMLPTLFFTPLGAYTLYVAYLRWSKSYIPAPPSDGWTEKLADAVNRAHWPTEIRPHFKILGSLWMLIGVVPAYIGVVLLGEWIAGTRDRTFDNVELYGGIGWSVLGALVLLMARSLMKQRTWSLIMAGICSLPLFGMIRGFGALVGLYTLWIGFLVWQQKRKAAPDVMDENAALDSHAH